MTEDNKSYSDAERMYEVTINGKKVKVNELVYQELLHDARELQAEMDEQLKEHD
jgi:hypothetical protein